jgi:hypothetical protein
MAAFPEHDWKVWKFTKTPEGWWSSLDNQRLYLTDLSKTLGFSSMENWYTITADQLKSNHGVFLLSTSIYAFILL